MATEGQIHFSTHLKPKQVHTWTNILWRRKWTTDPFFQAYSCVSLLLSQIAFSSWRIYYKASHHACLRRKAGTHVSRNLSPLNFLHLLHHLFSLFLPLLFLYPLDLCSFVEEEVLRGGVYGSIAWTSNAKIFGHITLNRCWYEAPWRLCSQPTL